MTTKTISAHDLAHFTGTEHYYRSLNPSVVYSDGMQYFCDNAEAYWLLDILVTELDKLAVEHGIIFITAAVKDKKARLFAVQDTGEPELWSREITYTDCPEGDWQFWMAPGGPGNAVVVFLPSEY